MEPQTQTLTAADLPPAVRAFWDSAPAPFKVPAILTAIDCYCALATRLRFKYTYDLDPHALLLQVLVVAEAASGKSFTRPIVKTLMQPLKLRDQEMKRIEQAYQDLKKTSAKNKQLPEEPITDVRCLQTITKAKLVKRADMFIRKYGEPLAFWFYNEELATMTESNKRAFADLGDLMGEDAPRFRALTPEEQATVSRTVQHLMDITYTDEGCDLASAEGARSLCRAGAGSTVSHGQLQPIRMVPMEWLDYHVRRWCSDQRQMVLKTSSPESSVATSSVSSSSSSTSPPPPASSSPSGNAPDSSTNLRILRIRTSKTTESPCKGQIPQDRGLPPALKGLNTPG